MLLLLLLAVRRLWNIAVIALMLWLAGSMFRPRGGRCHYS